MTLKSPRLFFDAVRAGILGPELDDGEVSGCNAVLEAMAGTPIAWAAYALATVFHETAGTMEPVAEANWLSKAARARYFFRMYDPEGSRPQVAKALGNTEPGDGVTFAGRGYVQLTGRRNYELAAAKLGLALGANPDLALKPEVAAKILRLGMVEGWFTGKSLADYLPAGGPAGHTPFTSARRIINGTDRADTIAGHAEEFQAALQAGGWA